MTDKPYSCWLQASTPFSESDPHRPTIAWYLAATNPRDRWLWRLECVDCDYQGGWIAQSRGPASKSKAEVASFHAHWEAIRI